MNENIGSEDTSNLDEAAERLDINVTSEVDVIEGRNLAADFLEIPEIKCTVAFFKAKIQATAASGNCAYLKKLQLKKLVGDYKFLEEMCREMFRQYDAKLKDPDNIEADIQFKVVLEKIVDFVQGCIVRHNITVVREDTNG